MTVLASASAMASQLAPLAGARAARRAKAASVWLTGSASKADRHQILGLSPCQECEGVLNQIAGIAVEFSGVGDMPVWDA